MLRITQTRSDAVHTLRDHLEALTRALDLQTKGVIRQNVTIVGAVVDERGHVALQGQYSTGELRSFTRKDYLPDGDDGSSLVYQVEVLEALALEHVSTAAALTRLEATQALLENPPGA